MIETFELDRLHSPPHYYAFIFIASFKIRVGGSCGEQVAFLCSVEAIPSPRLAQVSGRQAQ